MVFWLFKKRRVNKVEKDLEKLNKKLDHSFKNLHVDMKTINKWFTHLDEHKSHHEKRLTKMEKQLSNLLSVVDYHGDKISNFETVPSVTEEVKVVEKPAKVETIAIKSISPTKILEELTDTRKKLLLTLAALAVEMGNWVSMKSLTEEVYPSKKYSDVKSMVCDYTNNLYDLALIEKRRKGREVYLSLTQKGKELTKNVIQIEKARTKKKKS